jgi:hypothetical protein
VISSVRQGYLARGRARSDASAWSAALHLVMLLVLFSGFACSDQSAAPSRCGSSGSICGSDASVDSATCSLNMPLRGGVDGVANVAGVSSCSASAGVNFIQARPALISIQYGTLPCPGALGELGNVTIFIIGYNKPGPPLWETSAGGCTLNIASWRCVGPGTYVMSGTGACSGVASSQDTPPNAAIIIGDFTFELEVAAETS